MFALEGRKNGHWNKLWWTIWSRNERVVSLTSCRDRSCFFRFSRLASSLVICFHTAEGILFGFGDNKSAQLGQGHQKALMPKPVQVLWRTCRKSVAFSIQALRLVFHYLWFCEEWRLTCYGVLIKLNALCRLRLFRIKKKRGFWLS